jgi:hypothetical protein
MTVGESLCRTPPLEMMAQEQFPIIQVKWLHNGIEWQLGDDSSMEIFTGSEGKTCIIIMLRYTK